MEKAFCQDCRCVDFVGANISGTTSTFSFTGNRTANDNAYGWQWTLYLSGGIRQNSMRLYSASDTFAVNPLNGVQGTGEGFWSVTDTPVCQNAGSCGFQSGTFDGTSKPITVDILNFMAAPTPEPSTLILMGSGVLLVVFGRKRMRMQKG